MLPFLHTAAYLGIYLLIGVGISMLMGWAGLALVDWGIRIRKDKKSWFGMVLGWVVQLVGVYVIGRAGWILIDGALDFTPPDHAGLPVALGSGYVAAVIGWGLLNLLVWGSLLHLLRMVAAVIGEAFRARKVYREPDQTL